MIRKMTSEEICNMLDILVGGTRPVADSAIDGVVEQNLMTLIDIGNWVLDEVRHAAEHRKSLYHSSHAVGERAYAAMLEWKDWLVEIEEELA